MGNGKVCVTNVSRNVSPHYSFFRTWKARIIPWPALKFRSVKDNSETDNSVIIFRGRGLKWFKNFFFFFVKWFPPHTPLKKWMVLPIARRLTRVARTALPELGLIQQVIWRLKDSFLRHHQEYVDSTAPIPYTSEQKPPAANRRSIYNQRSAFSYLKFSALRHRPWKVYRKTINAIDFNRKEDS